MVGDEMGQFDSAERWASACVLLGFLILVAVLFWGGCAAGLTGSSARLKTELTRSVITLERARQKSMERAKLVSTLKRRLTSMGKRLAQARFQVQSSEQTTELLQGRLMNANARADAAKRALRTKVEQTREKLLSRCRTLPSKRSLVRAMRKKGLRRVRLLASLTTQRFQTAVVQGRIDRRTVEVRIVYQSKVMAAPASVLLTSAPRRRMKIIATLQPFLRRFVRVGLVRRSRLAGKLIAVKTIHFILRPGDDGLKVACVTRGDEYRRVRHKRATHFLRAVRFLPVKAAGAAADSFLIKVMRGDKSDDDAPTPAMNHSAHVWRYVLGRRGRCVATEMHRNGGPRTALDGLF